MTLDDAASLHLHDVIALDVMVLDQLLNVYQISSSFGRERNLAVISKLRVHLSL
jgi:hypothetical protein